MSHSGPLPAPETLAGYQAINPTFAERIMRMAEKQVDANVGATERLSKADARSTTMGAFTVPAINFACVALSGVGLFLGYPEALASMVIPAGSALAVMFRRSSPKPTQDKD